jgi:BolA protein
MSDPGRVTRLRAALEAALRPTHLEIIDDSAAHAGHPGAREGGHFRVCIASPLFEGRTTLQRHRLVYEALGGLMQRDVHALSIDARLPS